MKVGILTYHKACNFGANLQALSTINYLYNAGYEPLIINWMPESLDNIYKRNTPSEQYDEHGRFRKKYFPMSNPCLTDDDIVKVINENDVGAIIVGSDAVMQHHPFLSRIVFPCKKVIALSPKPGVDRMCPNPFWGSYYDKLDHRIPMCFMSASSQNSNFKLLFPSEKKLLKKYLRQFSYISTRDDWTSKMVSSITGGEIIPEVTPDPVFAFNYNVKDQPSKKYILEKYNLSNKYYLFSFHNSKTVSVEWLSNFQSLAKEAGIECVAFPFPQGIKFKHPFSKSISLPLSPLDWYLLIKYSSGYIGHNMHPIVISLHNAIPCFSFDNYGITKMRLFVDEKSSKIYHIMNEFGVLKNRVSCCSLKPFIPTPNYVFDCISNYDSTDISQKSAMYLEKYIKMMRNIEELILKK